MGKLLALLAVFRKGSAVADPKLWKQGQITTTLLGGFLIAVVQLMKAFGYDLPVDSDTASAIAGGIIAGANVLLTLATSKTVGLPGLVPEGQPTASPVQRPQEGPAEAPASPQVPRVDDATRRRAEEWQRRQEADYASAGGGGA
jgi:hypothetical protein